MVKIVDYKERHNANGEPFFALILQGGIELVRSRETGMFYATSKRASITSTFDEQTCKSLIGQELGGTIEKVPCTPFEVIDQETGEIKLQDFRWSYMKEGEVEPELAEVEEAELV